MQVKAIQCKPEMVLHWELPCMHTQTQGLPSRAEGRSEVPWGSRPGTDVLVSASVSHWHQIPSLPPKVKRFLAASVLLYSPDYRSLDHASLWLPFCPSSHAFPSFSDVPKSWCPAFLCCEVPRAGDGGYRRPPYGDKIARAGSIQFQPAVGSWSHPGGWVPSLPRAPGIVILTV